MSGPNLLSRDSSGNIAVDSAESVKYKTRYTNLAETLAFGGSLKPKGYELIELPYDFYCPSVQQKLSEHGGHRYQCGTCNKLFTTLALADKHIKLLGHKVSLNCPVDVESDCNIVQFENDTVTDRAYNYISLMILKCFYMIKLKYKLNYYL